MSPSNINGGAWIIIHYIILYFVWKKSLSISANTRFTSMSRTVKLSALIESWHNSASTSRNLKNVWHCLSPRRPLKQNFMMPSINCNLEQKTHAGQWLYADQHWGCRTVRILLQFCNIIHVVSLRNHFSSIVRHTNLFPVMRFHVGLLWKETFRLPTICRWHMDILCCYVCDFHIILKETKWCRW